MRASVRGARRLAGEVWLPGDKSISHRALILNAVAAGEASVSGLSDGADVASTAACLRALGVEVEGPRVRGVGLQGLRPPPGPLECGNSGTTMRLLAGLLAGQSFRTTLVGDESLSQRPMERVAQPLRMMGATVGTAPLRVGGASRLRAIEHMSQVASAQVKSALLLAGLYAEGETRVTEPAQSRNHTELMLEAMGAPILVDGLTVSIRRTARLRPLDVTVPGDFSAAAFWLVAAGLHRSAQLRLQAVGVNPTRSVLLDVLGGIGVPIQLTNERLEGCERVADLVVGSAAELRALTVEGAAAASLIDELPVLAVAACLLPGVSRITGAGELRVKESDRVAAMATGLSAMGADVTELADGWEIKGPRPLEGARVDSRGDHRVAMALAVAGALADGTTEIEGAESVGISYPGFWDALDRLCST